MFCNEDGFILSIYIKNNIPILFQYDNYFKIIITVEALYLYKDFLNLIDEKYIIVSNERRDFIGINNNKIRINDENDVYNISGLSSNNDLNIKFNSAESTEFENNIIYMLKNIEILPCFITFDIKEGDIENYNFINKNIFKQEDVYNFTEKLQNNNKSSFICESDIKIMNVKKSNIRVFRSDFDQKENYVISIGNPCIKSPIIRIHSSCYTGDLLKSLECDCRYQLENVISYMNENDGGFIIYLMQEGRGIGFLNKIRTYSMQNKGLSTNDANEFFGFSSDERIFSSAIGILNEMKIKNCRLVTGNKDKSKYLSNNGINVAECIDISKNKYGYEYSDFKKLEEA